MELQGFSRLAGVRAAVKFRGDGLLLSSAPRATDLDLETLEAMVSLCASCRGGVACTEHRDGVIAVCPLKGGEYLGLVCAPWVVGEVRKALSRAYST